MLLQIVIGLAWVAFNAIAVGWAFVRNHESSIQTVAENADELEEERWA